MPPCYDKAIMTYSSVLPPVLSQMPASSPVEYEAVFADTLAQVHTALNETLSVEKARALQAGGRLDDPGLTRFWEAMVYSTLNAGKRLRPVLAVECGLACGGALASMLPTACAIELVHTQSLIHDDLPCMDNDDLRRGRPTVHKAFDEATAVLVGDALIALAFGLIVRNTPVSKQVTAETLNRVVARFSEVTSVHGLVNGQYIDIYYEDQPYTPEVLEYIHSNKTGALFTFCAEAGALLAGADADVVDRFSRWGQKLGLAFQIVDDLLDIQSTPETLGKTPGKDQAQNKATYPALYGMEASRQRAQALIEEAQAILKAMPPAIRTDRLALLARFIQERLH